MRNVPIRGFEHLIGETITKIDARSVNLVIVQTKSGKTFDLDCDEQLIGIGIIRCTEVKEKENNHG